MSKFNLNIFLNSYQDSNPSNSPSLSNFRWSRDISASTAQNPVSLSDTLAPGETKTLANGSRSLAQDGTTQYSISIDPSTSNTYTLTAVAGTLPNFRTPRSIGSDATTQVTVTANGPLITFASTGGTAFNFTSVVVGDSAHLGNLFNLANQGTFKIVSKTSTSFSIDNYSGVAEGPITLGSGFADQVQICSAAGVQVDDTILINAGFSSITQGAYKITDVLANSLKFYSTALLPVESNVMTQVQIYSDAKQLVYLEVDKKCSVSINGQSANVIEPFSSMTCCKPQPGILLLKSTVYSMTITNNSTDTASIFLAMIE